MFIIVVILLTAFYYSRQIFRVVYNVSSAINNYVNYYLGIQKLESHIVNDLSFHKYRFDSHEFIIVNDDHIPFQKDVYTYTRLKYEIMFVSVKIDNNWYDITKDTRKFICYMSKDYSLKWESVLVYCFRDNMKALATLFNEGNIVEIHYNDDEMTCKVFDIQKLSGMDFLIKV